jgi:hypothetical protein
VHTDVGRRRGKSRPRILYWFRTPPGVRVGRSALDESAIRLIEEHNPDVEFDWTRILKGQEAPVEQKASVHQDRRGRPRPREFPPRPVPVETKSTPAPANVTGPEAPSASEDVEVDTVAAHQEVTAPVEASPADEVLPRSVTAEAIDPSQAEDVEPATPAEARLGSEGVSRLRARHAEVLARISEAVVDPIRREELKSQADRLNPDTWVTDGEVTQGLESYETVFESLRTVVGRRARRRRRSGRPKPQADSAATQQRDGLPDTAGADDNGANDGGEDL